MSSLSKQKIALWQWYDIKETSSTNDEIKKIISETNENIIVVSAKHQNKGRGRRGRHWQEIEGNLYFTYSYEIPLNELSKVVCLIGLSLAKTIKSLAPQANVQIKWPNDVFLKGGKISGILLENIKDNLWAIGIGVNIVGAPNLSNNAYKASSLKDAGINIDRIEFLQYYLKNFEQDIACYQKEGFDKLKTEWLHLALNYQKEIIVKTENTEKVGKFLTLDDNGYLILETKTGKELITAGDVFI